MNTFAKSISFINCYQSFCSERIEILLICRGTPLKMLMNSFHCMLVTSDTTCTCMHYAQRFQQEPQHEIQYKPMIATSMVKKFPTQAARN